MVRRQRSEGDPNTRRLRDRDYPFLWAINQNWNGYHDRVEAHTFSEDDPDNPLFGRDDNITVYVHARYTNMDWLEEVKRKPGKTWLERVALTREWGTFCGTELLHIVVFKRIRRSFGEAAKHLIVYRPPEDEAEFTRQLGIIRRTIQES